MENKICKNCNVSQPIKEFPATYGRNGETWYRGICKSCKNEKSKAYYNNKNDVFKVNSNFKRGDESDHFYLKNKEIREFSDYEFRLNMKWASKLSRKPYLKKYKFDLQEVVSSSFLKMTDLKIQYNRNSFYLLMWRYMADERYRIIRNNPYSWKNYLESSNEAKARYRTSAHIWYIKHLLSRNYTLEYINAHPELIEEKRKTILALRSNDNNPIENELPILPPELMDLSLLNKDYKGYAITYNGEVFSCKSLYRTDNRFTSKWYALSKRKNGCIRLNIKGVKKEFGKKVLVAKIYEIYQNLNQEK